MPSSLATYTPTPEVKLAGSVPDGLSDLLVSTTVEESVTGLARCEVRLDNWDARPGGSGYLFVDRATYDFGATLEVTAGPPDERGLVFAGRVTGIEAEFAPDTGPTLVLLAEDGLQDLRMTRRTRTFEDNSDADVVAQLARDHSLTPEVDLDGPTHAALCQLNQSDLAFLRDRALPYGADVWLDGRTLHVGKRDDEAIVLRHGRELLAFRVLADLALQASEQRVAGWDPDTKEAVLETADQRSLGADLGGDVGGGRLLADKFGDRPATTTLRRTVTDSEARAIAKGLYLERARRFVTGHGVVDGIAGLRAGRSVAMVDLGAVFDGTYRLSRVVHRYDRAAGYRTEIDVERSGIAR
jgi:phage protein D